LLSNEIALAKSRRRARVWGMRDKNFSQKRNVVPDVNIQNSEVNNVQNVTTVQKAITKSSVRQHGPPTNAKVGSGA
jgi:hypothetical protein